MDIKQLDAFFTPSSVAVIGASSKPGKIGYTVVSNLQKANFQGSIYPVNPKADEILGLEVTKQIGNLPQGLDLAVITLPRELVLDSLEELGAIQTKGVVVITAGFKEIGKEGYYEEQKMIEIAEKHNMALLGPNCLGMINTELGLNATFAAGFPQSGNIAFFSQSGALCVAILDWALGENIGFSKFVSLGNKAVLNEAHMLNYLGHDQSTDVILGYIENVSDGQEFLKQAQKISHKKPVIIIKSGTTAAGAKAASSHTGAIAGSDQTYEAAFKQSGIIRARDVSSLFTLAQAFSAQPLPQGPNIAIVTNSGGPGIMTADACENSNLHIARISPDIVKQLQDFLPPYASLYNPIDIIGDADAERYAKTLRIVAQDPGVHSIFVLLSPTSSIADKIEETAQAIIDAVKDCAKPVFTCFMGKMAIAKGQKMLQEAGIPCYSFPEPAIKSLEAMYNYSLWKQRPLATQEEIDRNIPQAQKVIQEARNAGSNEIVEYQAQEILKAYNLPTPKTGLARSSQEAISIAEEIGYPVVLKIASADISHKTDVSGVLVGLKDQEAIKKGFLEITSRAQRLRPEAHISGCLVQEMAPKGAKEIIIGFTRDPQFGPLIMFGLGGVYVEILKDIAFRLAPLTRRDAKEIIREIQTFLLLKGVRGEPSVNLKAIEDIILSMSQIALDFPEVLEAEFNPVLVNPEKAIIADVRLTLE